MEFLVIGSEVAAAVLSWVFVLDDKERMRETDGLLAQLHGCYQYRDLNSLAH